MAALITSDAAEFAAALPEGGKLAWPRRRHQDHRHRDLRRRLALRRPVRDDPPDQIHAGPRKHCGGSSSMSMSSGSSSAFRSTWTAPTARAPSRSAPLRATCAARPADPAVGRALVDPGGRAGDDRSRRQPRQARREGRRARRRAHPAGRDRRAGQSRRRRVSDALVDLLSIDLLSDAQIEEILDRAQTLIEENRSATSPSRACAGVSSSTSFTKTRPAPRCRSRPRRTGLAPPHCRFRSSIRRSSKGETLEDTATTLGAMRPDALVIRHRENGAPAIVAEIVDAPVINAGDGTNEHPTQALLDAATIRHRFGRIEGLKIAICGDIRHSRVARSNAKLLPRLGADVRLAGPPRTDAQRHSASCRSTRRSPAPTWS